MAVGVASADAVNDIVDEGVALVVIAWLFERVPDSLEIMACELDREAVCVCDEVQTCE